MVLHSLGHFSSHTSFCHFTAPLLCDFVRKFFFVFQKLWFEQGCSLLSCSFCVTSFLSCVCDQTLRVSFHFWLGCMVYIWEVFFWFMYLNQFRHFSILSILTERKVGKDVRLIVAVSRFWKSNFLYEVEIDVEYERVT